MTIKILSFNKAYAADFARLNYEWLNKYFVVEPHDTEMLEAPEKYIINNGGEILFAQYKQTIVGTVALIKIETGYYELAKMAVSDTYQGLQIGQKLLTEALNWCKKNKVSRVMLESNRKLKPALHLYKKVGFNEVPIDPNSPYERADIKMELLLA